VKNKKSLVDWLLTLDLPWGIVFTLILALGVFVILSFTAFSEHALGMSAVALFVAGAASAVGVFIGFLFGIPRTLQREQGNATNGTQRLSTLQPLGINTNLEQISDWLTKIIVGVGLVELKQLPPHLSEFVKYLAKAFDTTTAVPDAFVFCIVVYFAIYGFLVGYLWARVKLTGVFSQAEKEARERPEYYEGLMNAFLYQPMPKGFERAIATGLDFNDTFGPDSVRVWEYLACAYSQQYMFLGNAPSKDEAKIKDARDSALDAVKRAIQLDPEAKLLLSSLWRHDAMPGEDDLKVFSDDSDFAAILG
jgi:hypothetical protein